MQLGEYVNGLMMDPEWRFVTADAHDVHIAVNRHDAQARLVGTRHGRIAVARFITREKLGAEAEDDLEVPVDDAGGAWLLVFHPRRPDGTPMVGEPDMTVLEQLQQRDVWARRHQVDAKELLDQFETMQRVQQERQQRELRDRMRATAEENLFGWARANSFTWKPRIFVPGR